MEEKYPNKQKTIICSVCNDTKYVEGDWMGPIWIDCPNCNNQSKRFNNEIVSQLKFNLNIK